MYCLMDCACDNANHFPSVSSLYWKMMVLFLVYINIPVSGTLSRANVMFLQLIRCDDIYGLLDFAFGDSVGLEMIF